MSFKVTTQPETEPVTLAEAKMQLRVDHTSEDDYITSLITVARESCEGYQNRAYIAQSLTIKLNRFANEIEIPQPPLQSITSIKYIDSDGDEQTLADSVYDVDIYSQPGKVILAYNQSWPSIRGDHNGVEIIAVCGYGDAGDVPTKNKQAMLMLIAHLYENREATTVANLKEVPMAVKSLLSLDRNFV